MKTKNNMKTNLMDKIMVLFGFGNMEVVRCKKCKGINITNLIIKKGKIFFKWYHCKKCGRNFWSEEKMIYKRPKWFTRKKRI